MNYIPTQLIVRPAPTLDRAIAADMAAELTDEQKRAINLLLSDGPDDPDDKDKKGKRGGDNPIENLMTQTQMGPVQQTRGNV